MSLRTPLARIKGLGPAREGVSHWWRQRLTAVALVPLSLWFVVAFISRVGAGYDAVVQWLSSPIAATLLILFLAAMFYHALLGVQVVVEDYVQGEWPKLAVLISARLLAIGVAVASIVATLTLAL